ncbi:hypothetical protein QQF64_031858 [Cirrhinus molitorella]|uniref:CCHC-type domain-containing protein n=1 Tax=Cirrhinus molitorella TaxID=172907 RepID=A0ABR3MY60_9TELE
MILKGLPDSFKPFAVHITQSDGDMTFAQFKTKLRNFESTENFHSNTSEDNVMRASTSNPEWKGRELLGCLDITCYNCGQKGHKARVCQTSNRKRQWCSYCKSSTHKDENCRCKKRDNVKQATDKDDNDDHTFVFKASDYKSYEIQRKGLMVDTGATSHIITDLGKFKQFDDKFQPEKHYIELADGTRASGVALRRGDAEVYMIDSAGHQVRTTLRNALYIPSYPQNIFSVKAATTNEASISFQQGQDELIHKDAYSDADWVSDLNDRRSTTGYCFSLTVNGALISWKSKKQSTVALSTCEAEYMALAVTAQESMYLVQLLNSMENNCLFMPVQIFEDNQGAIALSKNPVCHQRCKHVDVRYHFIRSAPVITRKMAAPT